MKTKKLMLLASILLCGSCLLNSCSKSEDDPQPEPEQGISLSISGAAENATVNTIDLDKNFTHSFSVSSASPANYEHGNITAEIEVDNSLIEAYNAKNSTTYSSLPSGSYSFDKPSVVIANGSNLSESTTITINPASIDFVQEYLVPVTIKSATSDKITDKVSAKEGSKIAYLVIKGNVELLPLTENWTVEDASSVWQEINAVGKVWDGDRSSYWHSALAGMPQWFSINLNGYTRIDGFTWVNRSDGPARPKHVKFETSMDANTWIEVLDVPELPNTDVLQVLEATKKTIARYFRVRILSNWANESYTYVTEVSTWAVDKPEAEYDFEKTSWTIDSFSSAWDGWPASHVIDGNRTTTWHSHPFDALVNGMPQWFIVDMQKERQAIEGILLWSRNDDDGALPKHIVFSISNDKSDWTTILDIEEMPRTKATEFDYPTTTQKAGRYLKVEVKSNWGGNAWTYIGELDVY